MLVALLIAFVEGGSTTHDPSQMRWTVAADEETKDLGASVWVSHPSGAQYADIEFGSGEELKAGEKVGILYKLFELDSKKHVYSQATTNDLFVLEIGAAKVPNAFDQIVSTMRVGGRRKVIFLPDRRHREIGFTPGAEGLQAFEPGLTLVYYIEVVQRIQEIEVAAGRPEL